MSALKLIDLPPVWTVAAMALAWFMASVWAPLGAWGAWPGAGLIAAGLVLALWAALHMARKGTTVIPGAEPSALVTDGPFARTRNPIYLADLLILAGWCLLCGTVAGLLLLIPLWSVLKKRFVLPEEARLRAHFGAAFETYAARVPRWI